MLPPGEPKFRRRPAERPSEILAAALETFAAYGFQSTKLETVAKRAGVSKGAIYLYFETKADLFQAVVGHAVRPNLERLRALAEVEAPLDQTLRMGIALLAGRLAADPRISGVAKLVVAESRNHPELATIWHETVVAPGIAVMTGMIERAQARGEVRPGDARHYAFGLMGPLLLGMIWRETFEPIGATPVDVAALAAQHVDVALRGMKP